MSREPAKALLLGGSGFLGAALAGSAARAGLDLTVSSRLAGRRGIRIDLLDPESVAAGLAEVAPDIVLNAAGRSSLPASWEDPAAAFGANLTGAVNLLEAAAAAQSKPRLVMVSSAAVYGSSSPGAAGGPPGMLPDSPYGAAKAAMEVICGQYARSAGLSVSLPRPFNLLGPGARSGAAWEFATEIARAEAEGLDRAGLRLGNPAAVRDFLDVRDAADAIVRLALSEAEGPCDVCSGTAVSIEELAERLGRLTRLEVDLLADPGKARPADADRVVGSGSRLRRLTGWSASRSLDRSLADMLAEQRRRAGAPGLGSAG